MDNTRNNYDEQTENRDDRLQGDDTRARSTSKSDLTDPPRDQERLRSEEVTIDLPEVKDIPGQEHVHVPPLGELADTTISSDDEEGTGLLDELNGEEDDSLIKTGTDTDITAAERETLERSDNYTPTRDEENLQRASMDNKDFEGDALNESSFGSERTGSDLDTSGIDEDDANEEIGEEDEENNQYSLGSDRNEQNEER